MFKTENNEKYSAVFINEKEAIPKEIIPLGIYKYINDSIFELYQYNYLFEDTVIYAILRWQLREAKNKYCLDVMKTIIDQQEAFKELLLDL
jgi:hypothetical protein